MLFPSLIAALLLSSSSFVTRVIAVPAPQVVDGTGPMPAIVGSTEGAASCAHPFSCHPVDAQGHPLVRGVPGALSPTSVYSIFECVYAETRVESGVRKVHTCSYDKVRFVSLLPRRMLISFQISGIRALRPSHDSICQPSALPCATDPNFNPNASPGDHADSTPSLFSSQDEHGREVLVEVLPWLPMMREHMHLKMEHQ